MTVYDFARKLMKDSEYNAGGVIPNERKYLDAIGFSYTVDRGAVHEFGEDLKKFYDAMEILCQLQKKYSKQ